MYKAFFNDFINLFFPPTCLVCGQTLICAEKDLCTLCLGTLPETSYHVEDDNIAIQKFYGKVPVLRVAGLYKFLKKSPVQTLLHRLKYKRAPEIGRRLGMYYGMLLKKVNYAVGVDAIIPVPLHTMRLEERGYNQSEEFAQGLATVLCLPCYSTWLVRNVNTPTQTQKTRLARWENVHLAFSLSDKARVQDKQILLVDDLVTTGATLTACTKTLLAGGATTVRIATLAVAM